MIRRFIRRIRKALNPPIGVVYMLHRVDDFDDTRLLSNENMKVSPAFLDNFIQSCLHTHDFISLDELVAILNRTKKRPRKPFIVFTLDDGYKDNYVNGFPVFQKYNIPFAIYISTGFMDRFSLLWWYQIEDIILQHDFIKLSNGIHFSSKTREEKERTFLQIRKIILELSSFDFENQLKNLLSNYSLNFEKYSDELILTWDQLIEMSQSPLCTIAAHTVTHRRMSELSTDELQRELIVAKQVIESKIQKKIVHFAYPFGTSFEVNEKVVEAVKQMEYTTACYANGGVVRRLDNDLFRVSRTMLTQK